MRAHTPQAVQLIVRPVHLFIIGPLVKPIHNITTSFRMYHFEVLSDYIYNYT